LQLKLNHYLSSSSPVPLLTITKIKGALVRIKIAVKLALHLVIYGCGVNAKRLSFNSQSGRRYAIVFTVIVFLGVKYPPLRQPCRAG
jgi:hypothetical protein